MWKKSLIAMSACNWASSPTGGGSYSDASSPSTTAVGSDSGDEGAGAIGGASAGEDMDAEGIWSPDIEQAFLEAMAVYPPCGRRKIILSDEGKMYGRNELIARYIKLRTGKLRSRKQVSSHIQVLGRRHNKFLIAASNCKFQTSKDQALYNLSLMSSPLMSMSSPLMSSMSSPIKPNFLSSPTANDMPFSPIKRHHDFPVELTPNKDPQFPSCNQDLSSKTPQQPPVQNYNPLMTPNKLHPSSPVCTPHFTGLGLPDSTYSPVPVPSATYPRCQLLYGHDPMAVYPPNPPQAHTYPAYGSQIWSPSSSLHKRPLMPDPHIEHGCLPADRALQPSWQGRSIAGPKLRLVEMSGFVERQIFKDPATQKHLFVYINDCTSYDDPILETIDIRQIQDKFPNNKGGLREMFERGPQSAFFLVKFWANMNIRLEDNIEFLYATTHRFESTIFNSTMQCSTKVCSFGRQVVEKVEKEPGRFEGGRYIYEFPRSSMCDYLVNFVVKLSQLPEKEMMNNVLENFTILQTLTDMETRETLLCIAYVFEVSTSDNDAQHHMYRLTNE